METRTNIGKNPAGSFIAGYKQTIDNSLDSVGYSGNISIDPVFNSIGSQIAQRPQKYYYHYNHQGSVSLVTYQNGTLQQHLQYLPYGGIFVDHRPNSYASTYTFSAKEKDAESGYTYFGARYYSDNIMQWLSVDPKSDKYPSTSPYMYCLGNPIMYLDPQGESSHIPPALIGYIMEKYSSNSKIKTVGYAMQHPVNAVKVGLSEFPGFGLSNIASNFEVNLRNEAGFTKNEGSQGNAYRHTLWQSMITRDMGVEHAKRIGNAHEDNTDINPMQHIYKNLKDADNAVDLLNNAIGRRIGINNKNATNQQMSEIVLEEYRTNGLWEAQKTNEGYKIQKTQLSQEKYNEALNVLRTKGNDGMNK